MRNAETRMTFSSVDGSSRRHPCAEQGTVDRIVREVFNSIIDRHRWPWQRDPLPAASFTTFPLLNNETIVLVIHLCWSECCA